MAITTGQLNIWRYCIREATIDAMAQRIPFCGLPARARFFEAMRLQVQRATFCAKLDGFEYSRLKR
jgi:hypothetical protein